MLHRYIRMIMAAPAREINSMYTLLYDMSWLCLYIILRMCK